MRKLTPILGACLVIGACEDSTAPTGEGTLVVTVGTIGGDLDLDGYSLGLDGRIALPIVVSGTQELTLPAGSHVIELSEVAANCSIAGEATREFVLSAGATMAIHFAVECRPTGITVRTTTTGLDPDPSGYRLALDGVEVRMLGVNASVVLSRMSPGEHLLELTSIAPNCEAEGPTTRTVTVVNAELALVEFPLTCVAAWGAIRVQATTTGVDQDGSYVASLVAFPALVAQVGGASGDGHILQVPAGTHQVQLKGVAENCSVADGLTREATVTAGGTVRDTAVVAFTVACVSNRGTIRVTVASTGSGAAGANIVSLWNWDCYYCSPVETGEVPAGGNGTVEFTPLPGNYYVSVTPAGGCSVAGDMWSELLVVTTGGVLETAFEVTCGPPLIQVTAPTSGTSPDPEYSVTLWYYDWWYYVAVAIPLGTLAAGGTLTAEAPYAGWFWVQLGDVAANCTVQGPNPSEDFYLTYGQTMEISFPVSCSP